MAALANRKHELFAQAIAAGETQDRAYELAGYRKSEHSRKAASRLATNVDIQARAATLQERAAIKVECTVDDIARQLDEDRKLAREMGQASAAVSATMGKAKLLGMITDKVQADVTEKKRVPTREEIAERQREWDAKYAPSAASAVPRASPSERLN